MTRDPEQIIPYMVKISNGGPGTAKGVTLTDDPEPKTVIKRGETFTVDKGSWKSGQAPKGPFIADLGDIGPGEGRTLTYDLVVNLTAGITVTNTVTVTSQTPNSGDTTKTHIDPEQHS